MVITGVNVLVFLLALLVVEPWRRRKLVEKIEAKYVSPVLVPTHHLILDFRMAERHVESSSQSDTLLQTVLQQLALVTERDSQSLISAQPVANEVQEEDTTTLCNSVDQTCGNSEAAILIDVVESDPSDTKERDSFLKGIALFGAGMLVSILLKGS